MLPRLAATYGPFGPFDLVYLDPPYNTGNPFAYDDKVAGRGRTGTASGRR